MRRLIIFVIFFLSSTSVFALEGNEFSFKLAGDVGLLSHYVENGLSHSDKSPALQASFWFTFSPQFRLGVRGSNTAYKGSEDHFNLRGNAEIKVEMTSSSNLIIQYTESKYYNGNSHNGSILGVHLNISNFHVLYDAASNWEATKERSVRYALGGTASVFGDWKWKNEIGYTKPRLITYKPYLDLRTSLGKRLGPLFIEGAATATSESSQFNGRGDVFFILSATTDL